MVVVYSGFFLATLLAFTALRWFDKRLTFFFGILFTVYVTLILIVTGSPYIWDVLSLNSSHWNWTGKAYAILLSMVVIIVFGMSKKAIGLQLPKKNIKSNLIVLIALMLTYGALCIVFRKPVQFVEAIAFHGLMPSLADELTIRGVAPALLLGLIRGRNPPQKTPWTVVCLAAIPFGLIHGLEYSAGTFSFDWIYMSYAFAGGVVYGWIRFSTGSLLFPLLDHCFANVAFSLTGFIEI